MSPACSCSCGDGSSITLDPRASSSSATPFSRSVMASPTARPTSPAGTWTRLTTYPSMMSSESVMSAEAQLCARRSPESRSG